MKTSLNRQISINVDGLADEQEEDIESVDMLKTQTFCIYPGMNDEDENQKEGSIDFDEVGLTQKSIGCPQSTSFSRREREHLFKQAITYYRMRQFQTAIEILKRMIQDLENMCDKNNAQINTYDLCRYRMVMGNCLYQLKQYQSAKGCYNFKYSKSTQTLISQAQRLNNLGCCYAMTKNSSCLAFSCFSQSLSISSKLGQEFVKYGIYRNIANIYRRQKMPGQSAKYYQLALQLMEEQAQISTISKPSTLRLYLWSFRQLDLQCPSIFSRGERILKQYLNYILYLKIDAPQLRFDLLVAILSICFKMNKVTFMKDIFRQIELDEFKTFVDDSMQLMILSAEIYFKMATDEWKEKKIDRQTYEDYLKKAKIMYAKYLSRLRQQNLSRLRQQNISRIDTIKQSTSC